MSVNIIPGSAADHVPISPSAAALPSKYAGALLHINTLPEEVAVVSVPLETYTSIVSETSGQLEPPLFTVNLKVYCPAIKPETDGVGE